MVGREKQTSTTTTATATADAAADATADAAANAQLGACEAREKAAGTSGAAVAGVGALA